MDSLITSNSEQYTNNELHEEGAPLKSQFADLYKANTLKTLSQSQRRENQLQLLKERHQSVDEKRNLTDLFHDFKENDHEEQMDVVIPCKTNSKMRYRHLKNKLMLSEWFSDIPNDLELNWLFKLCPSGVRNLVIAYRHKTMAFSIEGKRQAKFISHLPGGGPHSTFNKFTVLDCVYNVAQKCYYVLDVLAWNGFVLKNSNTELRFYWIKSKLNETPELKEATRGNPFTFVEVNFLPAELPLLEEKLSQVHDDEQVSLDGIIFYHREVTYIENRTPLVGWLKPYMVPEMLHIPVHPSFMKHKPRDYICLAHYLQEKHAKKKRPKSSEQMER
ncbi:snurportin-1 isoform X2 [Photinus pyralis]|uniref:snurportin-1 isoform X2 n=1 Tax=Photinus pyralis TaxID=7054 RepID=UPI001266F768|nr:snurportin-1 isoform X2 [Photinus pyralis]